MKACRNVVISIRGPGISVLFLLLMAIVLSLSVSSFDGICDAAETVVGAVEDVMLIPSGFVLSARIDTGAALTSPDARQRSH